MQFEAPPLELSPKQQAVAKNLVHSDIISGYLASTTAEQREFEETLNFREKAAFAQAVARYTSGSARGAQV